MSESSRTAHVDDVIHRSRRSHAVMDHAPRVEMGGKSIAIIGGTVSTISTLREDERDEFVYEKGQPV